VREATREQIVRALQQAGVKPGDGLLVHSAIQYLGRPVGGVEMYFKAMNEALSPGSSPLDDQQNDSTHEPDSQVGTLAVPTFNFAFARGEPYDPLRTPSQGMGVFSEYVRQLPEAQRTPHPMQSLAVTGRFAGDLAGRDTLSAFDPGSAFERMLDLGFKLLLLGADIQAVSMLHYSEQRAQVPYRYWKEFTGEVRRPSGWEEHTYRMFVRDLDLDPQIDLHPVQEVLQGRGQWSEIKLNYGKISSCRLEDFVSCVDEFLAKDPWSLVTNRPAPAG
jgi:aminoglycoside 3-N-acetyltransferase